MTMMIVTTGPYHEAETLRVSTILSCFEVLTNTSILSYAFMWNTRNAYCALVSGPISPPLSSPPLREGAQRRSVKS